MLTLIPMKRLDMKHPLAKRIFRWIILVFVGGLIVFVISQNANKSADLSGEKVAHTKCTVFEKYDKKMSRGANRNYFIDSSCGLFRADTKALSDTLEVGKEYNWSSTVGNWANKQTIVSVESSSFLSQNED